MTTALTRGVLDTKRRAGEALGNTPYGWRNSNPGRSKDPARMKAERPGLLTPDSREQHGLKTIMDLRAGGAGYGSICQILDERGIKPRNGKKWCRSSVARIIKFCMTPHGTDLLRTVEAGQLLLLAEQSTPKIRRNTLEVTRFNARRSMPLKDQRSVSAQRAPSSASSSPVVTTAPLFREHRQAIGNVDAQSIYKRRAMRLAALKQCLGEPEKSTGERHLFSGRWVQLVSKDRTTVRVRNFTALVTKHPDAWIAFVEPVEDAGLTESTTHVTIRGVDYVVSMMKAADYLAGQRIPQSP